MNLLTAPLIVLSLLAGCTGFARNTPSMPLDHASERSIALQFGMYVTPDPEQNPIDPPEAFTGYHTGLDYEVFIDELQTEVPVYAICSGSTLYSGYAKGYGGVVVQRCKLENEDVTVLYGHLGETSLPPEATVLQAGDPIGFLAPARSLWSDGNRKHLHLTIHRGEELEFRGYVQQEMELKEFLDPRDVLPREAIGRFVSHFSVPEDPQK